MGGGFIIWGGEVVLYFGGETLFRGGGFILFQRSFLGDGFEVVILLLSQFSLNKKGLLRRSWWNQKPSA